MIVIQLRWVRFSVTGSRGPHPESNTTSSVIRASMVRSHTRPYGLVERSTVCRVMRTS